MSDETSKRIFEALDEIKRDTGETKIMLFGAHGQGGMLRDMDELKKKSNVTTRFFGRSAEAS